MNHGLVIPTTTGNRHTPHSARFWNRSGASTAVGGVLALDIAAGDAASTTPELALTNLIEPATAQFNTAEYVVCKEVKADDLLVDCFTGDGVLVQVRVNSTTDIAKGDPLKPVNSENHLVKATSTDPYVATALEARTTDDVGLIWVLFYTKPRTLS